MTKSLSDGHFSVDGCMLSSFPMSIGLASGDLTAGMCHHHHHHGSTDRSYIPSIHIDR